MKPKKGVTAAQMDMVELSVRVKLADMLPKNFECGWFEWHLDGSFQQKHKYSSKSEEGNQPLSGGYPAPFLPISMH